MGVQLQSGTFYLSHFHDIKGLLLHSATENKWIVINVSVTPERVTYADGILMVYSELSNYISTDYGKTFKLLPNVTGYPLYQNGIWFSVSSPGSFCNCVTM